MNVSDCGCIHFLVSYRTYARILCYATSKTVLVKEVSVNDS